MPDNQQPGGTQGTNQQAGQGQGGTSGQGGQQQGQQGQQSAGSFDEWLKGQDETVKGLYESHTKGLRSALESERAQRSELSKQLKDAATKAEKGSELEKALTEATGKLEAAERRATFLEEAGKPEIGCSNPRAAFLIAQAEQLFDRRGNPDWAAIKAQAPELFGAGQGGQQKQTTRSNAGAGTDGNQKPAGSMNDFIRRSAGRG